MALSINFVVVAALLHLCGGSAWPQNVEDDRDEHSLLQIPRPRQHVQMASGAEGSAWTQNLEDEEDEQALLQISRPPQLLQTGSQSGPASNADATQSVSLSWPHLNLPNLSLPGLAAVSNVTSRIAGAVYSVAVNVTSNLPNFSLPNIGLAPGANKVEFAEPIWEIERRLALAAEALQAMGAQDVSGDVQAVLDALRNTSDIHVLLGNASLDAVMDTAAGVLADGLDVVGDDATAAAVQNALGHPLTADVVAVVRNASANLFKDHVPNLLDAVGPFLSPELAKRHGMLVHVGDLSKATGVRGEELAMADRSFQGDMVADSEEQLALFQEMSQGKRGPWVAAGRPWTGGHVKYCFASDVTPDVRSHFAAAVQQIERATCLTFEDVGWDRGDSTMDTRMQRCNEQPAIFVMSRPNYGCYSVVGQSWMPSQQLQLQHPGCTSQGVILHELGHAIGMAHEHSRPDRDEFIKVNWDNIQPQMVHNFDISRDAYVGEPYEYLSLMHYDPYAFSTDRSSLPTIEATGAHQGEIGQRNGFTDADVSQLVKMYEPEVANCVGRAVAGTGCVDMPDDDGGDVCSGLSLCGGIANERCCACGGGVEVQCYEGGECPSTPPLPRDGRRDCIVDMTQLFLAHGAASPTGSSCIVHNRCDTELEFRCHAFPCTHNIAVGAYQSDFCQGAPTDQICTNPELCDVWDPNAEALYSAAEAVVEERPAKEVVEQEDAAGGRSSARGAIIACFAFTLAIVSVAMWVSMYSAAGTSAVAA